MSSTQQPSTYVSTFDYARVLRRRWKTILVGVGCGLLIAILAIVFLPKTYTATASILVRSTGEQSEIANGRTSGPVNLDTEAQLVTSSVVASRAQTALGSNEALKDLTAHVAVSVPPNSAVLNISFSDPDPELAAEGAQEFAIAYLGNRQDSVDAAAEAFDSDIQEAVTALNDELSEIAEQLAEVPVGSPERAGLDSQRTQLQERLASLTAQSTEGGMAGGSVGSLITEPVVPTAPSAPNTRILLASSLLLGLLFGLGAALFKERRDHRVHGPFELGSLGLDVLVPTFRVPTDKSIISESSSRYDVDAIRMMRNAILAQLPDHRGAILVVPVSDGLAAGSLATNLAATTARTGLDCVSVSTDSRQFAESKRDQKGLGDVLLGMRSLHNTVQKDHDEPRLRVLSAGSEGSLSPELLQGAQVDATFAELRRENDVVVAHVAPTSFNADAQSLAPLFDGVVLVAVADHSDTDEVRDAIAQFSNVAAKILGATVVTHDSEPSHATRRRGH